MNKGFLSIFVVLAIWCGSASAASTGTIYRMVCHTTGTPVCQVSMNGTPSVAACSTSGWHYTFDATSAEGKNIVSIILAAQLSKQTITIGGKGTCLLANGSEDLQHVYITTPP